MSLLANTAKMKQRIPLITPALETNAKRYYMVPNRRVRAFVGREDILARIETGFSVGLAPRIVVLRGLGGQGKTQVALEYCRRAKNTQVRGIFWVEATSESTLRKSFESIAERVKGPDDILQDADARVAFVLEKLGAWPYAWLIVFDNYDDPVSFNNVQDFIPMGEQGSILVTSRHAEADSLADEGNAIELLGLDEKYALELLFKQSMVKETDTRPNEGKLIVKRLGYHPLAIAQAGSYIKQQKIELHQFMDHYNRRREIVLQQTPHMSQYRRALNGAERETALNVFTTWELSFQQLQARETVSNRNADLLMLFAFFDCRDISENLFEVYCNSGLPHRDTEFPGGSLSSFLTSENRWNSDLFVEVLIDLTQMSLVQAWSREDADGFCHLSVHPLIKDWIRLRTDKKASQKYYFVAAEILEALIRSCWRYEHFEMPFLAKQAVLSHLDVFEENTRLLETNSAPPPSDPSDTLLCDLESWFGIFLSHCGRNKEAEELHRRALEGYEKARGPEHLQTLGSLNNLALTLHYQGKFKAAEEMYRHTLESREKVLGPEHLETLGSLSNLGLTLYGQGKYKAAEEIFRQSLESQEKVLGPEHPDTLRSLDSLALTLYYQGNYEAAKEIYRQTLESRKRVLGPDHPDTLRSLKIVTKFFKS
jgi:tetratricopeptide (TPR) repeat protein